MSTLPLFNDWSAGRKAAAAVFMAACAAALACGAAYLSGALFLVLNKADPRQASLTSIAHYWTLYSDDPPLREKLVASLAASGVALFVVLPAALIAAARQRRPLHGNARF